MKARQAAFENKDYGLAKEICRHILQQAPDYSDVSVFLGRLYSWEGKYDSARTAIAGVIKRDSSNYEAVTAMADLESWSGNELRSLEYLDAGLKQYPSSDELLLKKARILINLGRFDEASAQIKYILQINPSHSGALALAGRLREVSASNSAGISYDYDSFGGSLDPWHAYSVSMSRRTGIGNITGRINIARRFNETGYQYETDFYPRLTEDLYSYLNFGYSGSSIFPEFRLGISLYYSLPYSFETDGGIRYLEFKNSNTTIYTAALGKYYGNFWFSVRTYITPSGGSASAAYSLQTRYYFPGADDFAGLTLGSGVSPEDRAINEKISIVSKRAGLEYQTKISGQIIWGANLQYAREEISIGTSRTRVSAGIALKVLF